MSVDVMKLQSWTTSRVEITDGEVLTKVFLGTRRDANTILGTFSEYLPS